MRKFTFSLLFLAFTLVACTLNQPDVIVITATFLPETPAPNASLLPTMAPATLENLIQPTVNPTRSTFSTEAAQEYTVLPGDSLSAIADASGVSLEALLQLNQITNADSLFVGQVIRLPARPTIEGSDFKLLPDSRLVRAPGSKEFNATSFVNNTPGYLRNASDRVNGEVLTGAQLVDRVALEFSVDPRLLLALLEYRSRFLTNPNPSEEERDYALRAPVSVLGNDRKGLYLQLTWAADQLNYGYYRWNYYGLNTLEFGDGTRILIAPSLNAGTVGLQYLLSINADYARWQQEVGRGGFILTYLTLFGDPFANPVEPLVPENLQQPELTLPFASGQTWYFTGGPHGGYGSGSAWSAVDFAPPDDLNTVSSGCYVSQNFATAVASGIIARTAEGTVVLDLDGDGDESTGWSILYLHMATQDRVAAGANVQVGDRIGRPSCEGGFSTGTHMHIARRYNGEWIPVSCDNCTEGVNRPPLIMSGWTFYGLPGQEYQGGLVRGTTRLVAEQLRDVAENEVGW